MRITEIHIKLARNKDDKLKAFCSMTLDDEFIIRDIKVIEGHEGYFVAMPSRKMSDHCARCGCKNHLKARFCNDCGAALPQDRIRRNAEGQMKLYADVAHPINARCRLSIQHELVAAFKEELRKSTLPGYVPQEWDDCNGEIDEVAS